MQNILGYIIPRGDEGKIGNCLFPLRPQTVVMAPENIQPHPHLALHRSSLPGPVWPCLFFPQADTWILLFFPSCYAALTVKLNFLEHSWWFGPPTPSSFHSHACWWLQSWRICRKVKHRKIRRTLLTQKQMASSSLVETNWDVHTGI